MHFTKKVVSRFEFFFSFLLFKFSYLLKFSRIDNMAVVNYWNDQTFVILHIHIWRGKGSSNILTILNVFMGKYSVQLT